MLLTCVRDTQIFALMPTYPIPFLRLGVLLAIGLSAIPVSASVVLFDNLPAGSPNGYSGVSNTQWPAQAFSTSSTGFILTDASLRLWNQNGTTGNFEVQVWDSLGTSGQPGAQVGPTIYIGQVESLGGSGSLFSITDLNVPLVADTTYYLVVTGAGLTDIGDDNDSSAGFLAWDATNVNTMPKYVTVGSGWIGPFATNQFMQINAVPEPTSTLLILLASGTLIAGRNANISIAPASAIAYFNSIRMGHKSNGVGPIPIFPPSRLTQWLFRRHPAKSKFQAAKRKPKKPTE